MRIIFVLFFLMANIAHAEVFKCVDESTGKTTFTDTACPDKRAGNYIPVRTANGDSGSAADLIEYQRQENEALRAQLAEQKTPRKLTRKERDDLLRQKLILQEKRTTRTTCHSDSYRYGISTQCTTR